MLFITASVLTRNTASYLQGCNFLTSVNNPLLPQSPFWPLCSFIQLFYWQYFRAFFPWRLFNFPPFLPSLLGTQGFTHVLYLSYSPGLRWRALGYTWWCSGTVSLVLGVTPSNTQGTIQCQELNLGLLYASHVLYPLSYCSSTTFSSFVFVLQGWELNLGSHRYKTLQPDFLMLYIWTRLSSLILSKLE